MTPEGGREIRNDREYIHMAVAKSLERLQTDYIDLLYWYALKQPLKTMHADTMASHRFSGKTPVENIVATMKEYVEYVVTPIEVS